MATDASAVASVASGAGSGSPSTPAAPSTPSTPVSTPSTPVTPSTPAAVTPAVPATPATPLTPRDEIKAALAKVNLGVEPVKPDASAEPAKPAEAAATDEAKPAEGEVQPAEAEPNPLDAIGPLPVETLTKALREAPELNAMLEKAGIPVETLQETCRNAALTTQFLDVFATPEAASFARVNAEAMYGIDQDYTGMKSIDDMANFIVSRMMPFDLERDENGQPIPDPAHPGAFKSSGATARFMSFAGGYDTKQVGQAAEILLQGAQRSNDDDLGEYATKLQAAVDMVMDFRENGYKAPGSSNELTPQQKQREAELTAREQAIVADKQQATQQQNEIFTTKLQDSSVEGILPEVKSLVGRGGLTEALQKKATAEILAELAKELEKDTGYKYQKKTDPRFKGNSDNALKALAAFNVSTMKGKLHAVAQRVLNTYGEAVVQRSTARQEKIATQQADARMDPKGGAMSGKPQAPAKSRDDVYNEAESEVLAANGGQKVRDHNKLVITKFYEKMGIGRSA